MTQKRSVREAANTIWHQMRIKRLIRDQMGHGAQCMITVRETLCTDANCPGPATDIRIIRLDFRETRHVIHKPLALIAAEDIPRGL